MDIKQLFQDFPGENSYTGRCEVVLAEPTGKLGGSATVSAKPNSRPEAEVLIKQFEAPPEYDNNLLAFLNASPPRKGLTGSVVPIRASGADRRVVSFTLETSDGTLSASSGIVIAPEFFGFGAKETLALALNDLSFERRNVGAPKYWLIPLQGPFENHYVKRALRSHVLTAEGGTVVPFVCDGLECGLQIFEHGKKPVHESTEYDALAFGELRCSPTTLDETWEALPVGLLEALSFSLGADVTAPYIELRSSDGNLVKRFLFSLGHKLSGDGFAAFSKTNEFRPGSGIGPFLTAFFSLPADRRRSFIPPLNLLRSGSPGSHMIDDSITDLVKCLDNLCARHGFSTQELMVRLEPDNQSKVKAALAGLRKDLSQMASDNRTAGRFGQADVLDDIVGRLAGIASTSRNFGIAVGDLLRHLGLSDGEALEQHYLTATNGKTTWSSILSAARGEVIHKGVLHIGDRKALRVWFEFARHLHDLCKRIVLREVNYTGAYQASTNPWQGEYTVDRVTPASALKDLGFSDLPTKI